MFGGIETDDQVTEEGCASIGMRTRNDRQLALMLACGFRTFVCDPMAVSGDRIALKRQHTGHLDMHAALATAMTRYVRDDRKLQEDIQVRGASGGALLRERRETRDLFRPNTPETAHQQEQSFPRSTNSIPPNPPLPLR